MAEIMSRYYISNRIYTLLEISKNLQHFYVKKVTLNLTLFIMFLCKSILKLQKCPGFSKNFLNIRKFNWIFIKCY